MVIIRGNGLRTGVVDFGNMDFRWATETERRPLAVTLEGGNPTAGNLHFLPFPSPTQPPDGPRRKSIIITKLLIVDFITIGQLKRRERERDFTSLRLRYAGGILMKDFDVIVSLLGLRTVWIRLRSCLGWCWQIIANRLMYITETSIVGVRRLRAECTRSRVEQRPTSYFFWLWSEFMILCRGDLGKWVSVSSLLSTYWK